MKIATFIGRKTIIITGGNGILIDNFSVLYDDAPTPAGRDATIVIASGNTACNKVSVQIIRGKYPNAKNSFKPLGFSKPEMITAFKSKLEENIKHRYAYQNVVFYYRKFKTLKFP